MCLNDTSLDSYVQNACYIPNCQRSRLRFSADGLRPRVVANPKASISVRCAVTGDGETGGASRDRTDDPLLAKQVLSQLSYGPFVDRRPHRWWVWEDSNLRPHPYQGCALTT
jgi:hypothetical protein